MLGWIITGLALSHTGAAFACIPLGLLLTRIALEERFLQRALPGYQDYMNRVPYRLLPGIW